jgi:8-oxo-dGTP diphosphatase
LPRGVLGSFDAIHVAAAVLRDASGAVLLSRRPDGAHQGGLWEFPGGKVERGEDVLTALRRELDEELGITCIAARPLIEVSHAYPDARIWLDVWSVEQWRGTPRGRQGQPLRWVDISALSSVEMPAADIPVISAVRLPPVYLVTPEPGIDEAMFLERLSDCLQGGVAMVQFRAKELPRERYAELAKKVIRTVQAVGGSVLLNSEPELALHLKADGVHLTSELLYRCTQRPLPKELWVGASCHNRHDLDEARRIHADFAVLGPVCATSSHPGAAALGWEGFSALARCAGLPIFAIGGMRLQDTSHAWSAGGQGIAAIRSIWLA